MKYLPGESLVNTWNLSHPLRGETERLTLTVCPPDMVVKLIGEDSTYEGIRLLFDGLQQPLLNKQVGGQERGGGGGQSRGGIQCVPLSPQMTYVLLDIAVQELFPELTKVIM